MTGFVPTSKSDAQIVLHFVNTLFCKDLTIFYKPVTKLTFAPCRCSSLSFLLGTAQRFRYSTLSDRTARNRSADLRPVLAQPRTRENQRFPLCSLVLPPSRVTHDAPATRFTRVPLSRARSAPLVQARVGALAQAHGSPTLRKR